MQNQELNQEGKTVGGLQTKKKIKRCEQLGKLVSHRRLVPVEI